MRPPDIVQRFGLVLCADPESRHRDRCPSQFLVERRPFRWGGWPWENQLAVGARVVVDHLDLHVGQSGEGGRVNSCLGEGCRAVDFEPVEPFRVGLNRPISARSSGVSGTCNISFFSCGKLSHITQRQM